MSTRVGLSTRARSHSLRLLASAAAAAIVLLAGSANAAAHGPDPIFSGRWNQNQSLQFSWRSGSVPGAAYQVAIRAAAADASATRGSQAATFAYNAGASNLIGYGTGATCSTLGIACFSRNPPTSFSMWMREQGHRFDWGALRWCQAYTTWPDGCFDVENIILDEFGHVEILNHHATFDDESDYLDALVQAISHAKPRPGWNAHAFGRCDIASLQLQYDMQSWGAKYSTCLNLSTTLDLVASSSGVGNGDSTTLTASLKVSDAASYVRLGGNPVTLRNVRLQQRSVGSSSWLNAGTMTAGPTPGTYTMTLSPTTNLEFRAVFAKPADEGLRAATSPIVTVSYQPDN